MTATGEKETASKVLFGEDAKSKGQKNQFEQPKAAAFTGFSNNNQG